MDPFSVFAWIVFYMVVVGLFYWCFRQSMSAVASTPGTTNNLNSTTSPTNPVTNNHHRSNERRMAYTVGHGRNVYMIREENRQSDASDHFHPSVHPRPPPEYKWEDLPPTYEEAVGSFTNPTFTSPTTDEQPSTSVNAPASEADVVIELPASAASIN